MIRLCYGPDRTNPNAEDVMYLVALPIEPMPVGSKYPHGESLPMHCTVMHWFYLENYGERYCELAAHLGILTSQYRNGIELISKRAALFGPNADVPVHILRRNSQLNDLHTKLLIYLAERRSVPTNTSWIGAGYRAHVADVYGRLFTPGRTRIAREIVIVERKVDKVMRVVESFPFGDTIS